MGFSYTTIGTTQAHKHTNSAGDGGALDNTSLLNTPTLNDELTRRAVLLGS